MTDDDLNDPAKASAAYERMRAAWELPRALMGGTAAMRQAGEALMPRHPAESTDQYAARLKRTVLRNFFARSIETLTGKVFAKPMALGDDVPQPLRQDAENIDLAGRHLNIFARDLFRNGLLDGIAYVLVDFPVMEQDLSLAEVRERGARPYAVELTAKEVIGVRSETQGGRQVLTQARIKRQLVQPAGAFGEKLRDEVRVIEPDRWEVWVKPEDEEKYRLESEGRNTLGVVPLVPFYTGRVGFFEAEPPLADLAWMNLEHWQIRSDQRVALSVSSFPIMTISGFNRTVDSEIEFGPLTYLTTEDSNGKFAYLESSGAALAAGREELAALEEQMRLFALQFQVRQPGGSTATARAIDAAEAQAPLQAWAISLQDCLENVFALMARWRGLGEGGSLTVNQDYGLDPQSPGELDTLLKTRMAGEISRPAYLSELRRRGVLADDFDAEADAEHLEGGLGMIGREEDEDDFGEDSLDEAGEAA